MQSVNQELLFIENFKFIHYELQNLLFSGNSWYTYSTDNNLLPGKFSCYRLINL